MLRSSIGPIIRNARPGDERGIHDAHMRSIREVCSKVHTADEISGWGNRPYSDKWSKILGEEGLWVVELNDKIQGVAYIKISHAPGKVEAYIHGLYLAPEVIGLGLGGELMRLMLKFARSAGATNVSLDSSLNAHTFYKRFGFKDNGPMSLTEIGGSKVRGHPMALVLAD